MKWAVLALCVCVFLLCIAVIGVLRILFELVHNGPHSEDE